MATTTTTTDKKVVRPASAFKVHFPQKQQKEPSTAFRLVTDSPGTQLRASLTHFFHDALPLSFQ